MLSVVAALIIYTGPVFITNNPEMPEAAAIAVDQNGVVVETYSEIPETDYKIIELPGEIALPGLHDAHLHVEGIGMLAEQLSLHGEKTADEVVKKAIAFAKQHPEVSIITGRGWDQNDWDVQQFPTAKLMDGIDRPIYLRRVDGHAAWLNHAMLELVGITSEIVDPDGGRILRDGNGNPTGVLIDNALDLVSDFLPERTDAERKRHIKTGLQACADAGLVAVHNMGMSLASVRVATDMAKKDELPIRLFVYFEGSEDECWKVANDFESTGLLTIQGFKLYADGALGSRGAALLENYSDDQHQNGLVLTDPVLMEKRFRMAEKMGLQVAVHAIGDRGVRNTLNCVKGYRRCRIEHSQVVHPDDFELYVENEVIASMQPSHCTSDMYWAEERLGAERIKGAYAWRTMLDNNIPLAFGSDSPIEDYDPLPGIYAAVTRKDKTGWPENGWYSEQCLTDAEAIAAFSSGAAYAVGREATLGKIAKGYKFDATLLDKDPRANHGLWLSAKPVGLVVDGKINLEIN
ncbi:amidohydrolase [bacterium]|jgi:hypothetical protein|nr:amidohydrolase [bacterium]